MQDEGNGRHRLRPGDVVEVRTRAEILATLDSAGALDAVPFMPEMLQFVGRRFTVAKRVEKICDTIHSSGSRRMRDTVFLEDLRCDGAAHGGCQAECRIYWKEAWLAKVGTTAHDERDCDAAAALDRIARSGALAEHVDDAGAARFRCQATEAFRASEPIGSAISPGQYVREMASGNVSPARFLRVAMRAVSWKIGALFRLNTGARRRLVPATPGADRPQSDAKLQLQPGDWVEVRSAEEIGRTLNAQGTHRGLVFSPAEMLPACGRRFRVRRRIDRLIDEKTGRMLAVKNDCIALEGFVCTGEESTGRWFCARELYPYWREAWLKRVAPPAAEAPAAHGPATSTRFSEADIGR